MDRANVLNQDEMLVKNTPKITKSYKCIGMSIMVISFHLGFDY